MGASAIKNIVSERVVFPNVDGKKIAALVDARSGLGDAPVIVLAPKYGETKKNGLQLAYVLAANGFRVIRFDFTCHFGESDGEMLDFTLSEATDNVRATLDYVERTFGRDHVTLLASSLSSLAAVRAASRDRRVAHLVSIVGVVDLTYTLLKVYQEDLVGGFIAGRRYGVLDILGHEVNMDRFFAATIRDRYHRLEDVVRDVAQIAAPISWFPAAQDAWVRLEDVETVAAANAQMKLYPIAGAMHEVRENQDAADRSLRAIVRVCRTRYFSDDPGEDDFSMPDLRMLMRQNRGERELLRRARPMVGTEDDFWSQYLGKYRIMEKMGDFQQYLGLVGELLGEIGGEDVLLDAGCGNGLFGVWVMRELIQRRPAPAEQAPLYFGIDLTQQGLRDAVDKHMGVRRLLAGGPAPRATGPNLLYARANLEAFGETSDPSEKVLQFADECFSKIVCSLLISYLQHPDRLLRQFYRLLQPGGRIVVSSMKPYCDLSAIYRDFVEQKADRADLESARELLRVAGALKVKEEQGYYVFFSGEQLVSLLTQAGFDHVQCFTSLGNQANVVVGQK